MEKNINPFRLDNEVALITGGGTGLGLAVAHCMAASGARVVIVGRREEMLQNAVAEINAANTNAPAAEYVVHDVTDLEAAPQLVAAVRERVGDVSLLINNAGIHLKKWAVDTTEAEFLSVLTTHVLAAHALTRAVAPNMIEQKQGSIVFTASMTSLFGIPQLVAYSAAKSAYLGMVRTLAVELSPQGVRVNGIAPGWIETAMSRNAMKSDPDRERKILSRTPMGSFGKTDDIGWAAVYLCSSAARFVTGAILPVDGGASIGF